MTSASPWLAARAGAAAQRPAVEVAGRQISYAELGRRARAVAAELRARGIGRGDVVAALLGNDTAFVSLLHGVALCGAALLPLNLRWTVRELSHPLRDAGARLLVHAADEHADRAVAAAEASGVPCCVSPLDERTSPVTRSDVSAAFVGPDSLAAVLFTSGTSGTPRGAGLSIGNFFWSALASAARIGAQPSDRWLACMPFFHVGGLSLLLRAALWGNCVVVHERFDAARVNHALDHGGVTHVSLVGTMLARILEDRGDRCAPPQLRCVLLGGGPAPASLVERARALEFPIAPTYGLTEAASQVATREPGAAVGGLRPLLGTRVRVVDGDDRDVPCGVPGELLVRGPTVMKGYLNRPEETARALRGGWLHTGDVAVLAADETLRILERCSDLIVSGGENVYPTEVEHVLLEHPAIREAAVAGVCDAEYGQRPAAWLVFAPGDPPDAEQLRTFCRERLAGYKVPVEFRPVAALPRNAAGKLLRRALDPSLAPAASP